jgi:hypothetical protein
MIKTTVLLLGISLLGAPTVGASTTTMRRGAMREVQAKKGGGDGR